MEKIKVIKIYKSDNNGDTHFFINEDGKKIFSTLLPPKERKKYKESEHLGKIKDYLIENLPEIAKRFVSFKEYGIPYPKELSDLNSTPRAELLALVVNEFS